jgi:hypothetical protein
MLPSDVLLTIPGNGTSKERVWYGALSTREPGPELVLSSSPSPSLVLEKSDLSPLCPQRRSPTRPLKNSKTSLDTFKPQTIDLELSSVGQKAYPVIFIVLIPRLDE